MGWVRKGRKSSARNEISIILKKTVVRARRSCAVSGASDGGTVMKEAS